MSVKKNILRFIAKKLYYYIVEQDVINRNSIELQLKQAPSYLNLAEGSFIVGPEYVTMGENFEAGKHFRLEAIGEFLGKRYNPEVVIGNNVYLGDFCHIGCIERVTIGNGVLAGSKVFITDHYHGNVTIKDLDMRPAIRPLSSKPVFIGDNVWIGDGVCIMPGISIGNNVIIGANAVVTHSFPPNVVIAGCPAKVIKEFDK